MLTKSVLEPSYNMYTCASVVQLIENMKHGNSGGLPNCRIIKYSLFRVITPASCCIAIIANKFHMAVYIIIQCIAIKLIVLLRCFIRC